MTIHELDLFFPYFCFFYGATMTLVLHSSRLENVANRRLPGGLVQKWRAHRGLAFGCLVIGAAWILQNLWLT